MKTLVIIGSGFSGTVTAIEFLRRRAGEVQLVIVNRSGSMARGLAYGTNSSQHLLNVPAGNMTALVDEPDSFLDYCQAMYPESAGHSFMPRKLYGQYLHTLLDTELKQRSETARHVVAEVTHIERSGECALLYLSTGEVLKADHVVLAFGNFSPLKPALMKAPELQDHYHNDPWAISKQNPIAPQDPVLLLGSGLTALDVLASLKQNEHHGAIYMLSRRGLLPVAHRKMKQPGLNVSNVNDTLLSGPATVLTYLRSIRSLIETHRCDGIDWRDILATLRPITPSLWKRLPEPERKRFLRHLQPFWDVHRHRAAPQTYSTFEAGLESGQVTAIAGRMTDVRHSAGMLDLTVRTRKAQQTLLISVRHVINCTGPNSNLAHIDEPFITGLINNGTLVPDRLGLGLQTDDQLAVVDQQGHPSDWLSYVGPMLKAGWWEATAVPELRQHSRNLAIRLADSL
ncbi:FAD/NAD(P)-binding protein [Pseudomonas viridiflava]|uniref:FAD/NAD(P)-binding protein n=1 Tax=Pseudomonas viridiflava TaxID=33069 RepID=UPI000F026DC9|nr:FAD/NAD(P)-binding protein [Pseudomonas viridiflava]MEE3922906.1 FAD/NAD(P)-binding protein [Pseudomonas viridiflava]MEE3929100.1 FAD/NAD(P)-binding protein [Pseudomonas viridiflava]MEE3941472.1 FAD/NAD(P)-binding protein [Pseudomonas viridiflava]MEE3968030.1 FAD/NAD(P)-binding protein [Pseudomonas viridiflava]MEE3981440.1 FAD/NAD(P)-binding protein [Pseudomonas viridiflava]